MLTEPVAHSGEPNSCPFTQDSLHISSLFGFGLCLVSSLLHFFFFLLYLKSSVTFAAVQTICLLEWAFWKFLWNPFRNTTPSCASSLLEDLLVLDGDWPIDLNLLRVTCRKTTPLQRLSFSSLAPNTFFIYRLLL